MQSLTAKSPIRLSWTHYNIIQQELTADGRAWYENEAANEMWSTRTLLSLEQAEHPKDMWDWCEIHCYMSLKGEYFESIYFCVNTEQIEKEKIISKSNIFLIFCVTLQLFLSILCNFAI